VNHQLPGGPLPVRPALFTALALTVVSLGCSGGATGPSTNPPPPVNNTPPVVTSIVVRGAAARMPAQYASLGDTVNVTATVTDAETPVSQLIYAWTSSAGGTFSGSAAAVTWTAPATTAAATPVNATLTLTVTETFGANQTNRVTANTVVDLHNSPREVQDLAVLFLEDFSTQLPVDTVMRNFTATCPEAAQERADVANSNARFTIIRYAVDAAAATTTVPFTGVCPFRQVRGDACAQVPVSWTAMEKATGAVGTNSGIDQVTALLENGVWKLCASDYDLRFSTGDTGLATLMSRPHTPR
jgi:hypothetical protein